MQKFFGFLLVCSLIVACSSNETSEPVASSQPIARDSAAPLADPIIVTPVTPVPPPPPPEAEVSRDIKGRMMCNEIYISPADGSDKATLLTGNKAVGSLGKGLVIPKMALTGSSNSYSMSVKTPSGNSRTVSFAKADSVDTCPSNAADIFQSSEALVDTAIHTNLNPTSAHCKVAAGDLVKFTEQTFNSSTAPMAKVKLETACNLISGGTLTEGYINPLHFFEGTFLKSGVQATEAMKKAMELSQATEKPKFEMNRCSTTTSGNATGVQIDDILFLYLNGEDALSLVGRLKEKQFCSTGAQDRCGVVANNSSGLNLDGAAVYVEKKQKTLEALVDAGFCATKANQRCKVVSDNKLSWDGDVIAFESGDKMVTKLLQLIEEGKCE